MNKKLLVEENIRDRIYIIRGYSVMLDRDLAELYNVETKQINRAVKRNMERFPANFMFKLNAKEYDLLFNQYHLRFQNGTSKFAQGGRRYLPYVFTEQGVSMLSGVLRSDIAVRISIRIMNTFVSMRKIISSNNQIFDRVDKLEQKHIDYDKKFEKVFDAIEDKNLNLDKGIFFEGQIFDAYKFVSDIIKSANESIILIDNYIDESVLVLCSKRNKNVSVVIYTREISKQLLLDIKKYNAQYPNIGLKEFKYSHDRFIIIDNKELYHFGASLKDLGKKWFAFSKFDKDVFRLIERLELKNN